MLVPVLVGMDHMNKVGLILDLSDGNAVNGNEPPCNPYKLEKNTKGHYMVNIAHYLFDSIAESEAGIQQLAAATFHEVPNMDGHHMFGEDWYELAVLSNGVELQVHEHETQHGKARFQMFQQVVQRRLQINASSISEAVGGQVHEGGGDLTHGTEEAISSSRPLRGEEVDTVWSTLTDMEKEELKAITKKHQAALEEDDVELASEHHTTPQ